MTTDMLTEDQTNQIGSVAITPSSPRQQANVTMWFGDLMFEGIDFDSLHLIESKHTTSDEEDTMSASQEEGQLKQKEKVRKTKEFTINFKVTMDRYRSNTNYDLKVIKPDLPKEARSDLAVTVCLKKERAENKHAFLIMHNLHHKNILSLKVLAKSKFQSDNPSSVAAFVEPYSVSLKEGLKNLNSWVDDINHFPSPNFRTSVRDIITGLDFLWKNDLYHGNLNWGNTLWQNGTVKLAGFEMKDMDIRYAQLEDLRSLIRMLEEVSSLGDITNQGLAEKTIICDTLDSLIDELKEKVDQASLRTLKETVLEHPFFWNFAKRTSFFACTVSLKLSDDNFIERVRNSDLCRKSWDKKRKGSLKFQDLVTEMNSQSGKKYDVDSIEDYVKLICGAYTHWRQTKLNVDRIIRACYPMICIDMKRLVEA